MRGRQRSGRAARAGVGRPSACGAALKAKQAGAEQQLGRRASRAEQAKRMGSQLGCAREEGRKGRRLLGRAWEGEERAAKWTKARKKQEGGREGDWAYSRSWAK